MSVLSDNIVFAILNATAKFTGANAGKDLDDSKNIWPTVYAAAAGEEDAFAFGLATATGGALNLRNVAKVDTANASDLATAQALANALKQQYNVLVDALAQAGAIPE